MTTLQSQEQEDIFRAQLEKHFHQSAEHGPLQKAKAKAWDHFLGQGLPTRNQEVFRYIRLRQLFAQSYSLSQITQVTSTQIAPYIYPECQRSVIVFVNGHYQPLLSNTSALPKQLVVSMLKDAVSTYGAFLTNQWTKSLKEETDAFALVNAALHRDGVFVYIPPKCIIETPIQLLHLVDTHSNRMFVMPRLHLFVGAQSQASVYSSLAIISGAEYCINQTNEFALEEGAKLNYTQIACDESPTGWHFDAVRAQLKRDSSFKTVCITDGSTTVRHDYRIALSGENAEAQLNGLWMLADKREAHTNILIEHQAPHCRSMQLFKGVLNDFSKSSFEGKIYVHPVAQKTEAFQLNNNLLLSDRAHADSKPNLEIFADDVKASHGATVGQLDEEQLFYMKSRGFSVADAKNMLVFSFCKEIIDLISLPSLALSISQKAKRYLPKES